VAPVSDGDDAASDPNAATSERRPSAPPVEPGAADVETDDVDPVVFRTFWGSVLAVNVAMAAVPIGLLVIYFRGDWELGGLAIAVGAVAAVAAVRFYRIFRADREATP
jgi:hypothetical protein